MTTKVLAIPLILLAVGCRDRYEGQAGAASTPSPSATPYTTESPYASPETAASSAGVAAVVVAVDPAGRTVTLREVAVPGGAPSSATGGAQGKRYSVSSGAASSLNDLQAGEEVHVTCEAPAGTTTTPSPASLASCAVIATITEAGGTTGR